MDGAAAIRLRPLFPRRFMKAFGLAGLLASGSSYSPRLPRFPQWHVAAFIACYSCGTARDLHPLPYYPHPSVDAAPDRLVISCEQFINSRRTESQRQMSFCRINCQSSVLQYNNSGCHAQFRLVRSVLPSVPIYGQAGCSSRTH
jgi:hypothetical protein